MAKKELTAESYIIRNDKVQPFNGFTAEEAAAVKARLSRIMSDYYTQHPDEYAKLVED